MNAEKTSTKFNHKFVIRGLFSALIIFCPEIAAAQNSESIPFGDMERWLTREIKESPIIGGAVKSIYEVAESRTTERNEPYSDRGFSASPWATSSVYAHVGGIAKASVTVTPKGREKGGRAAHLECKMEQVRVLGVINISAMATGTIFTGEVVEPIRNTRNPQAKLSSGIPFTSRPKELQFDYKVDPKGVSGGGRVYDNGVSRTRSVGSGDDNAAEACIILQRRWESAEGEIFAERIATGWQRFSEAQTEWKNGHKVPIQYGDITGNANFESYMGLFTNEPIYAMNSRGEMKQINEVGWAAADATPTHLFIRFSASYGGAYIGAEGASFTIDNVQLLY